MSLRLIVKAHQSINSNFYTKRLWNCIHGIAIYIFFVQLFLKIFCIQFVERYYCKLNFQSKSSKLSKANISFVVRVDVSDNVKLILVFTFKAASVSSAKLSLLRTHHTRDNNQIQQSPPRIAPVSFLKATCFYRSSQRPPHLHMSSDNLRNFMRSDGHKKSRAPSWISSFPGLPLNDAHARSLKRYPPHFMIFATVIYQIFFLVQIIYRQL